MKKILNKLLNKEGFTLMELLIVIVIIGILSTILIANFIGVRERARDSQRKSDLRQIQSALELYRADQGSYPDNPNGSDQGYSLTCGQNVSLTDLGINVEENATNFYMKSIPCDQLGSSVGYRYIPTNNGYTLEACLENAKDPQLDKDDQGAPKPCDSSYYGYSGNTYSLQNP